jgi:hypothetical protein
MTWNLKEDFQLSLLARGDPGLGAYGAPGILIAFVWAPMWTVVIFVLERFSDSFSLWIYLLPVGFELLALWMMHSAANTVRKTIKANDHVLALTDPE